jgi:hypothetical protein
MKMFLLLTCVVTLFLTTGCLFPDRGDRGWHDRGELNGAASAFAVGAPEVIEGTPAVEVPDQEFIVLQF